jgi:predicted AAA+ superfamily ATPase
MFPFNSFELGGDFFLEEALQFGTLPTVVQRADYAVDILSAYVGTSLKQKIQQEALVEDVGAFHRFLKIAGLMNGEIVNVSGVSRDAGVTRMTAERYFDILVDTLIAVRLSGWQPRLKVRERSMPK